jgi:hypothetical protein
MYRSKRPNKGRIKNELCFKRFLADRAPWLDDHSFSSSVVSNGWLALDPDFEKDNTKSLYMLVIYIPLTCEV